MIKNMSLTELKMQHIEVKVKKKNKTDNTMASS